MRFVTLMLVGLLAIPQFVHGQNDKLEHNGFWWKSQPEAYKIGFVTSYAEAASSSRNSLFFQCLASKNGGTIPEKVPDDATITECGHYMEARTTFPNLGGMTFGQISEGIDKFYSDYRNKNLHVTFAFRFASDELLNKPINEIEAEVVAWRKTVQGLQ